MRQCVCISNAILLAAAFLAGPSGAVDVINTVAGNGANSNFADGIAATASAIDAPTDQVGVAIDASGNIFYTAFHCVRRIDAVTGIVTTVAGTGRAGFSGDGSAATAANLNSPQAVCVDSTGNLFIADTNNQRIRKVTIATGVITTVAGNGGGPGCNIGLFAGDGLAATSASLNHPQGVCVDSSNNIFIADTGNDCIREVNAGTGIVSTYAGQGGVSGNVGDGTAPTMATFGKPVAVAVDSGGSVYIADAVFNRVRMISGPMITNFAGSSTGVSGYSGDTGLATSGLLSTPTGLAVDSNNNIYIADRENHVVRQVANGTFHITTVVGTGVKGFSGDGAAATLAQLSESPAVAVLAGPTPDIVAYDHLNFRIRKVHAGVINTVGGTGSGAFADGAGASASFFFPNGMFVDPMQNVYIADTLNNRIRKIDGVTGVVTTIAGTGVHGFSGDGGPAVNAQISKPEAVFADGLGNVIFCDTDNSCVRRIDTSGNIHTIAGQGNMAGFFGDNGPATSALLDEPDAVSADAAGNLYILDGQDNIIRKVSPGGIITTIAGSAGIVAFAGDGGPAAGARFCGPLGLFVEPMSGNIYIADSQGARIRRIDPTGIVSTVAGNGLSVYAGDGGLATAASLAYPVGVSAGPNGDIFIADFGAQVIRKVDGATGLISTIVGTGVPGFFGDGGVATSAKLAGPAAVMPAPGGLVILDSGNNRVRRTVFNGPPVIASVAAQNPVLINTSITVTVTATDPENDPLTYTFDPGDGTGPVNTGAVNAFTHTFASAGVFATTLTVSDPYQSTVKNGSVTVFAPASGGLGVGNIAQADPTITKVTDPVSGISISVTNSNGGVVELFIDIGSLTRDDFFSVSTDFAGIAGRSLVVQDVGTVTGVSPVQQFAEQGIYVATSMATRLADNSMAGKARKTLVIDRAEVGDTALKLTAPKSRKVVASSLKGNFIFGRSGASSSSGKSNSVTLSGSIALPGGLDTTIPTSIQVAIGNIVDSVTLDSKGAGKLPSLNKYIQKFQVRLPKPKSGTTIPNDKPATFSVTFNDKALAAAANMVDNGFDTEGVSSTLVALDKGVKSPTRQIQLALSINGVAYQSSVMVTFKRSSNNQSATISGRSAKN